MSRRSGSTTEAYCVDPPVRLVAGAVTLGVLVGALIAPPIPAPFEAGAASATSIAEPAAGLSSETAEGRT